jgi:hypothetical protein
MSNENNPKIDFSRRTEALAAHLGIDLGDLPPLLGFSRASLFAYRSGKARITGKAWRKLEDLESRSGIRTTHIDPKLLKNLSEREWFEYAKPLLDEANSSLGIARRAKELALESVDAFSKRVCKFENDTLNAIQSAKDLCKMITTSSEGRPPNKQMVAAAKKLHADLAGIDSEIGRFRAEALALRQLAESSQAMMEILRSK